MPVALSYPGVYVQEIPSGVHTITGVATSTTAFLGRALLGPTDDPTTINSFGDFERIFGGLVADMPLGYAVRDFFLNGGSQAIVVRLFSPQAPPQPQDFIDGIARNDPKGIGLPLAASSPGTWANWTVPQNPNQQSTTGINVKLDVDNIPDDLILPANLSKADLFNLTINYIPVGSQPGSQGIVETLRNVSVKEGPRRVDRVLQIASRFVQWDPTGQPLDFGPPPNFQPGESPLKGGSDSQNLLAGDITEGPTLESEKRGIYALDKADLFNILCIPPDVRGADTAPAVWQTAMAYCADRRAMLIVDSPVGWNGSNLPGVTDLTALNLAGLSARNAAIYFPLIVEPDPLREGQLDQFVPCGVIAGTMARTDSQRGVWKAPAGIDATLAGVQGLALTLDNAASGQLNPLAINCLRIFPGYGIVVWGARTVRGTDQLGDEYKYIPIRRLALYIEESLYRGLKWVVFEPNDEPLWSQIRLNVGSFMHDLFRQGAFQGQTPQDAYFVKCDKETTTQSDRNLGIVNILVGFAPLKPAEFVVLQLQQMAGQIQV